MSIKTRKSKRIKFGMFATEAEANEVSLQKSSEPRFADSKFYTIKVKRPKEGQRSWLAYCLTPR